MVTEQGPGAKLWDVPVETRGAEEIAALVRCRAPWRLEGGRLVPAAPDPLACAAQAAGR